MKYFIFILLILSGIMAKAQLPSSTFMSRDFNGNTKADWIILDSPMVNFVGTTLFNARYAGTQFVKIGGGDTAFYFGAGGNLWFRLLLDRDTISLSNRINSKLNISDTANRWWGIGKRWVDTVYRVNDSTVGFTINEGAQQTFQILGRLPSGGGGPGTVTSVALSMPSAFNVTPSSITTSGTFSVTGAGTTSQYIRGNGTLATFDTGAIPNFYLKVRGLLSGTSPITFSQITGAIGINNANNSGTKGAATFTGAFSDNGSGTIDLLTLGAAGSCTGCNLNIDAKGRITGYADGAGGATNNTNLGAGLRILNSATQGMRTLFAGFGTAIDSVANANGLTWSADTTRGSGLPTYFYADSLFNSFDVLVNSGLSKSGDTAQLGSINTTNNPLNHNTWINTAGFKLTVQGSTGSGNVFEAINLGSGTGVFGQSVSEYGVLGSSTSLYGVYGTSTTSNAIRGWTTNGNTAAYFEGTASSTNTVIPTVQIKRTTSGLAAAGIGSSIEYYVEKDNGANNTVSNSLRSLLTTATSGAEVSQFEIYGVNGATLARKFAIAGNGQQTWDGYPALTPQIDTTTYKPVAVNMTTGAVVPFGGWVGSGGGSSGGGITYIYSATGPTGGDTLKYWIKTPSTAAVYNIYAFVNSKWERYGWLDSVTNVFSLKRPITLLICGQSNAAGIGTGGDTASVSGILAFSSDSVYDTGQDYQTKWVKAQIGKSPFITLGGVGTNNIGFQVAKQLKKHGDADIIRIIGTYQGGTNINAWISDGSSPTFLRDTLISRLNRSGIDTIDVFCWHQGEGGGITGFTQGGYVVDQRVLYDTLCSPLVVGFFRNYTKYIAGGLGYLTAADSAQTWNVGSPEGAQRTLNFDGNLNTGWVPSWGLGHFDDSHFSGTGIDSFGYRYYTEALRLPHAPYAETPEFNYDTTYDKYKVYVDRLFPYNGGGSSMKYIDGISMAYMKGGSPLMTIAGTSVSGTVNLGATLGYSDAVPKMFQVNGKAVISDGSLNTIIGGNWNVTGNPMNNVVIANYLSTFNPISGGDESVLIGYNAGYTASSNMPFNSVVIGSDAGNGNASANFNVYIGRQSGENVSGTTNTFIGYRAGRNIAGSGGGQNTAIGADAGAVSGTALVNSTAIGYNTKYNEDSVFRCGTNLKKFYMDSLDFKVNVTPTNGQYFAWNSTNSQFELTTPSGATTIYNGDGTLSADRTVTGSGNDLTYNSIFNYRINANSLLLAESSPDAVYSVTISGANNQFLIGYTPTPTVYSKGYGVYIDTNNNAGLAIAVPTTVPLYATGNSAYVNGLQSGGGNYYKITNITGNATAALDQYWVNIDATGGNVTVTLPAASTAFGGFVGIQYVFKRTDNSGNTVTIARAGSDTIDGATSISLTTQYEAKEIQCVSTSAWAIK